MDVGELFCQGHQRQFKDQRRPETETKIQLFLILYGNIKSKTGRVIEKRSILSIFHKIFNDISKNMFFTFRFSYQSLSFIYFYPSK